MVDRALPVNYRIKALADAARESGLKFWESPMKTVNEKTDIGGLMKDQVVAINRVTKVVGEARTFLVQRPSRGRGQRRARITDGQGP